MTNEEIILKSVQAHLTPAQRHEIAAAAYTPEQIAHAVEHIPDGLDELAEDLARVVMIGGMTYPNDPRPYDPYPGQEPPRAAIVCPKCHGAMRTYERNGIQLEQCGSCRGLFLDFGELEHLTQMEGRFVNQAPPPPGYGPAWGKHGDRRYRKGGLAGLFFSS